MKYSFRMWTEGLRRKDEGSHLIHVEAPSAEKALDIAIDYLVRAWQWAPMDVEKMRYNVVSVVKSA